MIDGHAFMLALQGDLENHGGVDRVRDAGRAADADAAMAGEVRFGGNEPGAIEVDAVVNSRGLARAGRGAPHRRLSVQRIPQLVLAKGNYFSYSGRPVFSRLIYPTPVDGGLGVHVTLDLAGRMRFGPDVEWIETENYEVDPERADSFYARIRTYWPDLPDGTLVPDYAGIRPKLTGPASRRQISWSKARPITACPGSCNLFGIESPGLTSSLPLAEEVVAYLET